MTTRVKVEITLRVSMKRVETRGHRADTYYLHKVADRWERRHGVSVYTYHRTTALVQLPVDYSMGWARYVITLETKEPTPRTITEVRDLERTWGLRDPRAKEYST